MNLLFDLDGTLADPFEALSSSMYYACDVLKIPYPTKDQIRKCIGPPIQQSVATLVGDRGDDVAEEFIKQYRKHHTEEGIYHYRFFPEIDEVLPALKTKHRIFVATSKPTVMAKKVIEHFGKDKYFEKIYGAELDGVRSQKGDLLKHLLHEEKLNAQDCVMIGDRMHDTIAANKNKIDSLGVLWGYGSKEELEKAGTKKVVNNWDELKSYVMDLN